MSNHARIFFDKRVMVYLAGLVVLSITLAALPVAAQTPTPWPTPIVTNDYIIVQEVTYGDGGIIIGLLFVGGLLLLDIWIGLSGRMAEK